MPADAFRPTTSIRNQPVKLQRRQTMDTAQARERLQAMFWPSRERVKCTVADDQIPMVTPTAHTDQDHCVSE